MTPASSSSSGSFSPAERDLIRREFGMHFGSYPSLTEGILLRVWRSGPLQGQPKVPSAVRSMLERGLVEVRKDRLWAHAIFTEAGLAALRTLAADRRFLPPDRFEHLRQELGLTAEKWRRISAQQSHQRTPVIAGPADLDRHSKIRTSLCAFLRA
jgi:hypothetical protein